MVHYLQHASKSSEVAARKRTSNKCPDDAVAADPGTTL